MRRSLIILKHEMEMQNQFYRDLAGINLALSTGDTKHLKGTSCDPERRKEIAAEDEQFLDQLCGRVPS